MRATEEAYNDNMASSEKYKITKKDIEIIKLVYQFRLVTVYHLVALTGRIREKVNTSLAKLSKHGYLYRRCFYFKPYLYTINKKALPILIEQGVDPRELPDKIRIRTHELTELFLKHTLMVVDIHVALARATKHHHVKLTNWQEHGKKLYDSVTFREDGEKRKLPVRPDAFFSLEDITSPNGQNQTHIFLEADRSTEHHKQFQNKLKAYQHYHQQGLHTKKHNINSFRVLTITLTKERAENLCKTAQEVLPKDIRKFYYFAPMNTITTPNPEHIFNNIFISPKDFQKGIRYQFVPSAPSLANTSIPALH